MEQGRTRLSELATLFLRLGLTAFGGPAAHVAMMRDEVVRRRGWLTEQQFLDLLSAANLIPGPNSTELAIHVGWARRRWAGLLVAGASFIVPAMLMTGALGWAYVRFERLPETAWLLWGIKPVIVAIVAQAIWKLAPLAAPTWPLRALGAMAAVASALGVNELAILFAAGALVAATRAGQTGSPGAVRQLLPILPAAAGAAAAPVVTLSGLFGVFLKIG
ncbi:MAG TPA: chromate transporter, partial [Polyangia bacterium]|nr:chromate transporter [Polyangia bacterium]